MLKFICGTIDAIQEYLFNSVEKFALVDHEKKNCHDRTTSYYNYTIQLIAPIKQITCEN